MPAKFRSQFFTKAFSSVTGKVDMLIGKLLVVELKVVEALNDVHRAQVIAYLQALKLQLGLLINFNVVRLSDGIKRVIRSNT
jgi:GxxExxY protein